MRRGRRSWTKRGYLIALCFLTLLAACSSDEERNERAPLSITCLFPMTGPGASLGDFLRNGVELAKEDLAAQGVSVELNVLDSKNQPREAVSALRAALALKEPDAVISAMSSVASAVTPIVEREGVLTVVTTTALTDLPVGKQYVIRVYPTSVDFVHPVAQHMARQHKKVAIMFVHDDFGDSNQRIFRQDIESAGGTVVAAEPYELQQTDLRSVIQRVLAAQPEAIFVTGYGPAFIAAFKQLRELPTVPPLYTEIGFANPSVLAALGADAEGIVFDGTPLELSQSDVAAVENFRRRYTDRFGSPPYQVAGFAYDSVMLLSRAAEAAGGRPTKRSLIDLSPYSGVMGTITLDQHGESRIELELMMRTQGATVALATH